MSAIIRVINPNSNTGVTAGMAAALVPLKFPGGPHFDCITLGAGGNRKPKGRLKS